MSHGTARQGVFSYYPSEMVGIVVSQPAAEVIRSLSVPGWYDVPCSTWWMPEGYVPVLIALTEEHEALAELLKVGPLALVVMPVGAVSSSVHEALALAFGLLAADAASAQFKSDMFPRAFDVLGLQAPLNSKGEVLHRRYPSVEVIETVWLLKRKHLEGIGGTGIALESLDRAAKELLAYWLEPTNDRRREGAGSGSAGKHDGSSEGGAGGSQSPP